MAGLDHVPVDPRHLVEIVEEAVHAEVLAVDTETTGFDTKPHETLRGVSFSYRVNGELRDWYVPLTHPGGRNFSPAPIRALLDETDALVCMHNAPFDMNILTQIDVTPVREGHLYDTQVGDWLIDENLNHKLKDGLGVRYFGEDAMIEKEALAQITHDTGRDFPTFTCRDIAEYAAMDTNLTYRCFERQLEVMGKRPDDPTPDLRRELQLQHVTAKMLRTGIRVDTERAEGQYAAALARRDELREVFAGTNMNSAKQVGNLIYGDWGLEPYLRTPGGKRSTSKEALEPHAEVDPRVAMVLEHRRMDKACSGFYKPLAKYVADDGRIHPSMSSARTKTGRFTCSDPNLQTIPREDVLKGIRACFIPADGKELWEYDLDSAELRIIGAITREEALFSAMAEGRDLHSETAASVFGPDFTGLQRRLAKNMNYGYPYFIGADKLARYLAAGPPRRVMTPALIGEAKRMKQRYAKTYPRMTAIMGVLKDMAERDGFLPLHKPGRFRRFRTNREGPKYYTALNALVQGAVAEVMKDLMLEVAGNVDGIMCLQVHDSLVLEVEPGDGEQVQKQLQGILDEINPFPQMPMPISAKKWGT